MNARNVVAFLSFILGFLIQLNWIFEHGWDYSGVIRLVLGGAFGWVFAFFLLWVYEKIFQKQFWPSFGRDRVKIAAVLFTFILCFSLAEALTRVAGVFFPKVKYLSEAGKIKRPVEYKKMADLIDHYSAHLVSHRVFLNYRANSLGFYDEEFQPSKKQNTIRIMSLGDSFCFSLVPYPFNVMRVLEQRLNILLAKPIEVLNFGVPSSGVRTYRWVFELTRHIYKPDIVVIHFYMGNDGPNTLKKESSVPLVKGPLCYSHFTNFMKNFVNMKLNVPNETHSQSHTIENSKKEKIKSVKGGEKVNKTLKELTDNSPEICDPCFSDKAFLKIMAAELGRFYKSSDPKVEELWEYVFHELDLIRTKAKADKIAFVMVLYPSSLQIYPEMRKKMIRGLSRQEVFKDLGEESFDMSLPGRRLKAYCAKHKIACLDLTRPLAKFAALTNKKIYRNNDTHWNICGNRLAAFLEADFLNSLIKNEN